MNFYLNILRVLPALSTLGTFGLSGQDYFKKYAPKDGLPVKVYYVNNPKPMETRLLTVDDTKGILKTTQSEYSLRELKTRNNIDRFVYTFPPQTLQHLKLLANEQYDDYLAGQLITLETTNINKQRLQATLFFGHTTMK